MRRVRYDHVTPHLTRARDALSETGALDAAHDADRDVQNAHLKLVGHGIEVDRHLTQLEQARASMRVKLFEGLETFTPEDIGRMIDGSPLVRNRVGLRIKEDPKGAKYDGNKAIKNIDGSYMIHIDQDWMRRVLAEELSEIAETNHEGFVKAFEAVVTDDDATLAPMRAALETFVENSHGIDEERASTALRDAEDLTTDLHHEPRATLLEWGALLVDADDATLSAVAGVLRRRAQRRVPHENGPEAYRDAANILVDIARAWAQCGFPMLAPSHKLAASLMATDTPREFVPELAQPWQTFALLVPTGLLPMQDRTIKLIGLVPWRHFHEENTDPDAFEDRTVLWLATERSAMMYIVALPGGIADLADLSANVEFFPNPNKETKATLCLLGRLLLGAMIELDGPAHEAAIRRGPPAPTAAAARPAKPHAKTKPRTLLPTGRAWTFALTRDVRVDLRPWVRDFVAGGGTKASVRFLRRGHHKRQPHGPRSTLRKWIHIEPTWVNREAQAVAVRAHRMDAKKEEP